jgi:hypothetical protein
MFDSTSFIWGMMVGFLVLGLGGALASGAVYKYKKYRRNPYAPKVR